MSEEKKQRALKISAAFQHKKENNIKNIANQKLADVTVPENLYQIRAEQNSVVTPIISAPVTSLTQTDDVSKHITSYNNISTFLDTLKECGSEIPDENLSAVLKVLIETDKLKDTLLTIAKSDNQKALLDLEQMLNVGERKLQHVWEYGGFKDEDDVKFKNFLTWRRTLKGAIFFWKKLYESNALVEMEKAWNAYTQDPNEKVVLSGDRTTSALKRFQITTESYSTILNTRRPFTRVFYAKTEKEAYESFVQWMKDRQLHEDKTKTTIVELSNSNQQAT